MNVRELSAEVSTLKKHMLVSTLIHVPILILILKLQIFI
jgi:hypothetical protein